MKIVDKRNQLYEDLNQIDDNQIIDRYKFLNIYPCTLNELKLLGYNENIIAGGSLSNTNGSSNGITSGSGAGRSFRCRLLFVFRDGVARHVMVSGLVWW